MVRYLYRVDKRKLSDEEKKERALFYNEYNKGILEPIDVDEFVKNEIYEETVEFVCGKCGYIKSFDFEDVKEYFEKDKHLIPHTQCLICGGVMKPIVIVMKK